MPKNPKSIPKDTIHVGKDISMFLCFLSIFISKATHLLAHFLQYTKSCSLVWLMRPTARCQDIVDVRGAMIRFLGSLTQWHIYFVQHLQIMNIRSMFDGIILVTMIQGPLCVSNDLCVNSKWE